MNNRFIEHRDYIAKIKKQFRKTIKVLISDAADVESDEDYKDCEEREEFDFDSEESRAKAPLKNARGKYLGTWKFELPQGYGVKTYKCGDIYKG